MKNSIRVLFILATIIVPGIVAKAQTGGANGITITQVIGGDSQAAVSGSYTLASGYTFIGITIDVQPTGEGGGQGGEGAGFTDGSGNFSAGVQVPPNLTYDVQAYLTVTDGSGNTCFFFSNLVTGIFVPSGPPGS